MKANLKTLGEKGKGLLGKGLSSGKDLIQSGFSVVKGALMKMDTTSPDFWPNIDKACNDGQYEMVVSVLERQRGRLEFEQEFSGMSHNALAAEDNKSAGVHIPVRGGMLGRVGLNKNKKIKGSDENALHLSVKVKYAPLSMWSKFKKK